MDAFTVVGAVTGPLLLIKTMVFRGESKISRAAAAAEL
jgi:hypothetical protein